MKKHILLVAVLVLCLVSCNQKEKSVVRIDNQEYTVVCDSVYSRMPGNILFQNGIIYWRDAFSSENFMHAVNATTGEEILSFGNIGDGPEEFTFPLFSLSPEAGLFLNDLEKNLEILYKIDGDSLLVSVDTYERNANATRLLRMNEKGLLFFCPSEEKPFDIRWNGSQIHSGAYPIAEEITNGYDVFQGNLNYNPNNSCLVYAALRFPYLSVYNWDGDKMVLKNEVKTPIEYTVADNELKLAKNVRNGAMELALTDKYIVVLQRDEMVEGEKPVAKSPRDMSTLPRSLFVYDYDLNLKKIINMPFPLLRLCGDVDCNTVYAIGINPEFNILKINLDD